MQRLHQQITLFAACCTRGHGVMVVRRTFRKEGKGWGAHTWWECST